MAYNIGSHLWRLEYEVSVLWLATPAEQLTDINKATCTQGWAKQKHPQLGNNYHSHSPQLADYLGENKKAAHLFRVNCSKHHTKLLHVNSLFTSPLQHRQTFSALKADTEICQTSSSPKTMNNFLIHAHTQKKSDFDIIKNNINSIIKIPWTLNLQTLLFFSKRGTFTQCNRQRLNATNTVFIFSIFLLFILSMLPLKGHFNHKTVVSIYFVKDSDLEIQ